MIEIDVVRDPETIEERLAELKSIEAHGIGKLADAIATGCDEDAFILRRGLARLRTAIARLEQALTLRDGPFAGAA